MEGCRKGGAVGPSGTTPLGLQEPQQNLGQHGRQVFTARSVAARTGVPSAQFWALTAKRVLKVLDAGPLHGVPVGLHVLGQELFLLCL